MKTDLLLKKLSEYQDEVGLDSLKEYLRQLFKSSLFHTCKYLLGYKDVNWHTHGNMIRCLEDVSNRKLCIMPRGTFKSSIGCVGYPVWRLMNNPNETILIDSEVFTNARNFIREIRARIATKEFVMLFGDWTGPTWSESEITISERTEAIKEASITAGGIETVKVGQHYGCIIGDDYNSSNNSQTPENRAKVINHYKMNQSILNPGGTYVLIGTRYAVDDIYGHVLNNEILEKI